MRLLRPGKPCGAKHPVQARAAETSPLRATVELLQQGALRGARSVRKDGDFPRAVPFLVSPACDPQIRARLRRFFSQLVSPVDAFHLGGQGGPARSEERRVGKECRSRW